MSILTRSMLLSCLVLSCGKAPVFVDPAFQPLLDKFAIEVGVSAEGVSIAFGSIAYPTLATCTISGDDRSILVDRIGWNRASEESKEELIYHELGHCVLNRKHTKEMLTNGCPGSVMYPYEFGNTPCYSINKAYYYRELRG